MLQMAFVILIYVLLPILVIIWAVKRYKQGIKPDATEITAISLAVLLISVLLYNYSGSVTDRDQQEIDSIVDLLKQKYDFPVNAKFSDEPAVIAEARARYLSFRVYGITEPEEQKKLIIVFKKLRKQIASKDVIIEFYKEEVWQEKADGSRFPMRDQEQQLRKISIQ